MEGCSVQNNSNSNMDHLSQMIQHFFPYAQEKLGFFKPVMVSFQSDEENANKLLGRTAHYNPDEFSIAIFVDGRHPKDILRSFSHELVHHAQNCNGDFESTGNLGPGYAQENEAMRNAELDAYKRGNIIFRDFEDLIKKGDIEIEIDFEKAGEPKMSLKEWKNNELNGLLMEKWGYKVQKEEQEIFAPNHYCAHHVRENISGLEGHCVDHNWNERLQEVTAYEVDFGDNDIRTLRTEELTILEASLPESHAGHPARHEDEDEEVDEGFDPTGIGKHPRVEDEDEELDELARFNDLTGLEERYNILDPRQGVTPGGSGHFEDFAPGRHVEDDVIVRPGPGTVFGPGSPRFSYEGDFGMGDEPREPIIPDAYPERRAQRPEAPPPPPPDDDWRRELPPQPDFGEIVPLEEGPEDAFAEMERETSALSKKRAAPAVKRQPAPSSPGSDIRSRAQTAFGSGTDEKGLSGLDAQVKHLRSGGTGPTPDEYAAGWREKKESLTLDQARDVAQRIFERLNEEFVPGEPLVDLGARAPAWSARQAADQARLSADLNKAKARAAVADAAAHARERAVNKLARQIAQDTNLKYGLGDPAQQGYGKIKGTFDQRMMGQPPSPTRWPASGVSGHRLPYYDPASTAMAHDPYFQRPGPSGVYDAAHPEIRMRAEEEFDARGKSAARAARGRAANIASAKRGGRAGLAGAAAYLGAAELGARTGVLPTKDSGEGYGIEDIPLAFGGVDVGGSGTVPKRMVGGEHVPASEDPEYLAQRQAEREAGIQEPFLPAGIQESLWNPYRSDTWNIAQGRDPADK